MQHVERLVSDHGVDAAGHEARRFLDHDNFLAHARPHIYGGRKRVIIRLESAHNLQQFHLVDWVEEVHPDDLFGAVSDARNLGQAEGTCIGGKDGGRATNFIEEGEDLDLRLHFLGHGFDDQVRLPCCLFHGTGVLQAGESRIGLDTADFANLDCLVQIRSVSVSARRRAFGKMSSRTVRYPPSAAAWAIPRPMVPAPMTAMV